MNFYAKTVTILMAVVMFLSGCAKENEQPIETTAETTVTEPEADHTLLRPFTLNEAFSDVTAGGRNFEFPIPLSELEEGGVFEDCEFKDNKLYFPDGSYADAYAEDQSINTLYFTAGYSPSDFSVIGIMLGDSSDIVYSTGIPDQIQGDMRNGSFRYDGAERQNINFYIVDGRINMVSLMQ